MVKTVKSSVNVRMERVAIRRRENVSAKSAGWECTARRAAHRECLATTVHIPATASMEHHATGSPGAVVVHLDGTASTANMVNYSVVRLK